MQALLTWQGSEGEVKRAKEKRATEEEMIEWHHRCKGHELGQTPGDGKGQESLVCCSPLGHKELDTTERLNWTELQHARLPCPSLSPGVSSNSCPLSQWCHPTSAILCHPLLLPLCFPASGSYSVSRLFTSGDWRIGASASTSDIPVNIQGWFPLIDWFDLLAV